MFNSDPHWLKNVITGDETWVYGYDPETKKQSSQWLEPGEPRFKKARMIKSKLKCLLITFFDVKGLVHYEFMPEGQTINQHYYLDVLGRLCVRNDPKNGLRKIGSCIMTTHGHIRPSLYNSIWLNMELLYYPPPQPPYYPDLAPNDFFLYPKIKKVLKGRRFDSIPETKENTKNILKSLKDEDFQRKERDEVEISEYLHLLEILQRIACKLRLDHIANIQRNIRSQVALEETLDSQCDKYFDDYIIDVIPFKHPQKTNNGYGPNHASTAPKKGLVSLIPKD
ncbi:hypothetical protein LAZ67_5003148 [Cordylochernes scorpioides]|uniref:Mariner Mos1 transposase n=1 Tax=Cordylochernes scorpioides TaxID=51811 RepID=A0ABY6KH19_9ARAC|nr:hypothetical protein LAZ67_5003148 [Cordylochernes scorpioides]